MESQIACALNGPRLILSALKEWSSGNVYPYVMRNEHELKLRCRFMAHFALRNIPLAIPANACHNAWHSVVPAVAQAWRQSEEIAAAIRSICPGIEQMYT